ncbi:hypothetical protein ASPACDRAFT_1856001 [Aspergillus aculeatus ATCC 16872]|uniref:Uncharacterized protein n=1 Tax=Aspergillus aculeatus (strain ATCC 16872 / CBS 172.66 / WB 5094) TaxID=690307 RepID=A0A1L9WWX4_ASPA1|nr:uncharacterized protein ASPACDRAFT_1856001 [Aspergillus aculeatus ATCC 16872]OJK00428.1 hypothetical protein ASPACDRAFT_1856001 [Aspergillus aculeatus ATCC 16872]
MSHRPAPPGHVDFRESRHEGTIEGSGGSKSIRLSLRSSSSSHRSTSSGASSKSLSSEEVESLQRAFSPNEISISLVHSEIERHQYSDYAEVRPPSVVPEGPAEEIPHVPTGLFDGELFESPDSDLSSERSYVSANEPASGEKEGSNTTSDRPRPRRHRSTAYSARTYPIRTAKERSPKVHSVPASEGGPGFYQFPSTEPGVTVELRKPTTSDSPNSMYYSPPTFQYQKPMRPVTYWYGQRASYRYKKPSKSTQDPPPPPPAIVTPAQPVSGPSPPPALEVESPPGSIYRLHARPVANASSFLRFVAGQRSAKRTFLKPNP